MTAVIALVGRPNVGKSTLFNRLTGRRDALVAGVAGLTRDRRYGSATFAGRRCTLIDTGGLVEETSAVASLVAQQTEVAVAEADLVLFLVDARAGLTVADEEIASRLRRSGRRVIVVVNKIDGTHAEAAAADFARLGFDDVVAVSAAHGRGLSALEARTSAALPERVEDVARPQPTRGLRLVVVGRPNVGKSTLVNRWLGEERLLVYDQPGTTRDAIEIPFDHRHGAFVLIDTAGVRRKGRVDDVVEKYSIVKSLAALESADVAVLLVDASEGLVDQDLHVLRYALDAGVGIVIAVNKWDRRSPTEREQVRAALDRRLDFAPWVPIRYISALHGTGVPALLADAQRIHRAASRERSTHELSTILERAVAAHQPPTVQGRRIKLRYAHKSADRPFTLLVHGNQTEHVPASYTRYLENCYRDALGLEGVPVRIQYKTGVNPFAGRRNILTPRQRARRERVRRHARRRH
jgi:GTP-binding protein